jgi:hypothetical protein
MATATKTKMATATKTKRTKKTGENGTVNKAQAIRDAAKEMGGKKVRPKDVIVALAAKGITVSSPQVSSTLKAAGYRKTHRQGRPVGSKNKSHSPAHHEANGLTLEHLMAAKALISKLGSVEAAKKALDVMAKLV